MAPIQAATARALVREIHYSGKVVNNSQLHLGAFLGDRCLGVMSFGPPMDRSKVLGLVAGTKWTGMLELNRLAFAEALPRNSESRCLAVAFRLIRKHYPHVEWVLSFADGAQCGDGTIYRAAGFWLTGIKPNNQVWRSPDGEVISRTTATKGGHILGNGAASMKPFADAGWRPIAGYQLRYLYPLNQTVKERLTVPIMPYALIEEMGAGMYRGQPRAGSIDGDAPTDQVGQGGSNPTPALV